jgi:hypothetical protein
VPTIRLLALDIDGTLVNSENQLTGATKGALLRALSRGVRVVLATGRRYSRALPLVEPLGIDAPLVTASGALIKRPSDHSTLFRARFDRTVLLRLLSHLRQSAYDAVLYGDTFHQGFDFYCTGLDPAQPELADFLGRNPGYGRVVPDLMHNPPPDIFAGFAIGGHDEMQALDARLGVHFPGQLSTHVLRSPRYVGHMCEINPPGVTKWSGILHLAVEWGISAEEICAVGDDVNDIPMIREAGLGVAMGNALEMVKAAADRVAPTHDQDGLVQVVEWIVEGAGGPC